MKENFKYIPPIVTKTNFFDHPILDYGKDIKELHVNPKLETQHIKKFDRKHVNVHQYEPKSFRLKQVKIGDDYDIEGFKKSKFSGLNEYYGKSLGIKDKKIADAPNPNYYEFKLKGENDGVFLVKNWRKELGTGNAGTSKQDFMESYKKMIEDKDEPIHLGDKKIKMGKEEDKPQKKEEVKVKIEPVLSHIEDKMDVKDLHTQVEKMFEEKKPKTIRIKKQKEDSNKIALEILDDILKDVDEMQRKEDEKREKRKKKETDKEDRKQKKASIKETREILEGILEKKLEEKETPIKEKRKTIPQIEEDIETHFESSIENLKGYVEQEAYVKDLESLTTEINKLLELKPSGVSQKNSLNEETEKYFKETILPILEKLDISEESLLKQFFNKKTSTNFTYGNLQALKRSIMKFQKEYRLESDIKEEK